MRAEWCERIERLFEHVMADRGHMGWTLRWAPDGYCWRARKIIDLGESSSESECRQWLLHEIAHIEVVREHGSQHVLEFWVLLEELMRQYLNEPLDEHQLAMKAINCPDGEGDITATS